MEKTIKIDGKDVKFKATGGNLYRYKNQFKRDMMGDLAALEIAQKKGNIADISCFYDIAWVLAKTADPSIPDPQTWLDNFDYFPIQEVAEPLIELITQSITTGKN